jgi:nucleotide-binding universal stress UspA family protein
MSLLIDALDTSSAARVSPPLTGPIVVATSGGADDDDTLRAAWTLAGRTGADVELLSVVPPPTLSAEPAAMPMLPVDAWEERRHERLAAIRAQLRRTCPGECEWPVTVVAGTVGEAIAEYVQSHHPRLVVMGRGRHRFAHRLLSPEGVLQVLRLADAPVLAVEPDATALPHRVVMATDFSAYSTYAARIALSLVAPGAVVYLVHVRPEPPAGVLPAAQWTRAYDEALPRIFAKLHEQLAAAPGVQMEDITLTGDPTPALIEFAAQSRADLVVSATHGRGFVDRLILGSVATDLLRAAPCSFLCVPGRMASVASRATMGHATTWLGTPRQSGVPLQAGRSGVDSRSPSGSI